MTDPIALGRIDESFHQVAAAVVEEVLVRLGHTVQVGGTARERSQASFWSGQPV